MPKPFPGRLVFLSLLVVTAVAAWVALDAMRPHANWLRVEAPQFAVAGEHLRMRIRVNVPLSGELRVDLHWSTRERKPRGYLSTGQVVRVPGEEQLFDVEVPVVAHENIGHVNGVIFVSPTRRWGARTHAAYTDAIPVRDSSSARPAPMRRLRAYVPPSPAPERAKMGWAMRITLAALWALAAAFAWQARGRSGSRFVVIGCAVMLLTSLVPAAEVLGDLARRFARERGLYHERLSFQMLITAAVAALTVITVVFALRHRERAERLAWVGLAFAAGISIASFLSLHELDVFLAQRLGPLPRLHVIQILGALVTLVGCSRLNAARPAHPAQMP